MDRDSLIVEQGQPLGPIEWFHFFRRPIGCCHHPRFAAAGKDNERSEELTGINKLRPPIPICIPRACLLGQAQNTRVIKYFV